MKDPKILTDHNSIKPNKVGNAESVAANLDHKDVNPFSLEALRLSQNFHATAGVKRVLTQIPVKKPDKTNFVRTRLGERNRLNVMTITLPEEREVYVVSPTLGAQLLHTETACRLTMLRLAVTRQGSVFLWPVNLPGPDGRSNTWNDSALEAALRAETAWVRIQANQHIGAYDVWEATGDLPDPEWPSETFEELLAIAFRDRLIDQMDHPVLRRLRGEV